MSLACFKKVWNFLTNKNVYFLIRTTYKVFVVILKYVFKNIICLYLNKLDIIIVV